jgi:hypothetical protein
MRYLSFLLLLGACDVNVNDPTYFPGNRMLEVGGMPADPNMMAATADTDVFALPFRPPTAAEQMTLDQQSAQRGYTAPWLSRDDIAIEISYVIQNVDSKAGTARVSVNGADEFTNYDLTAIMAAEAMLPLDQQGGAYLALIQGIPVMIDPGKTYQGVVREDDFAEAELDLDAIGRWMAVPAEVLINRSEVNPIGLEMVPANEIVPAMFRVLFTFESDVHMTCTYIIRVRDKNQRLQTTTAGVYTPMPTDYSPPPVMTGN